MKHDSNLITHEKTWKANGCDLLTLTRVTNAQDGSTFETNLELQAIEMMTPEDCRAFAAKLIEVAEFMESEGLTSVATARA